MPRTWGFVDRDPSNQRTGLLTRVDFGVWSKSSQAMAISKSRGPLVTSPTPTLQLPIPSEGLVLPSIRVQGYRCFEDLSIPHLGRVNLIVGKNGVGKSALIEALRLYCARGSPVEVRRILLSRDELERSSEAIAHRDSARLNPLALFPDMDGPAPRPTPSSVIGPLDDIGASLTIGVEPYEVLTEQRRQGQATVSQVVRGLGTIDVSSYGLKLALTSQFGGPKGRTAIHPLDDDSWYVSNTGRDGSEMPPLAPFTYLGPGGLVPDEVGRLFDQVALTPGQDEIVQALRIVSPTIEGVTLVGIGTSRLPRFTPSSLEADRFAVVGTTGMMKRPVPLKSMGDGASRLFGITLALVNASGGLFLADEIENGIHYSVQTSMWKLIFQLARSVGVQVFAATHSWDCIEAFQAAAVGSDLEGTLVRLETAPGGSVRPVVFTEHDLRLVKRERIEIR